MSEYSDENKLYFEDVKVFNKSFRLSCVVNLFYGSLEEFLIGLRKPIWCVEGLQTEGYIDGYKFIDTVAT